MSWQSMGTFMYITNLEVDYYAKELVDSNPN